MTRTRLAAALAWAAVFGGCVALLAAAGGCRTIVVSTGADGSRKVEVYSLGNDTQIEELSVPTPAGTATVKGASSQSRLSQAAADIAAATRSVAGAGAKP